jgi:hypothetical protein
MKITYDHKDKILGGAFAINDAKLLASLANYTASAALDLDKNYDTSTFCQHYLSWIQSTKLSTIKGLGDFQHSVLSLGTTETFDKFYMKHHAKRFRCFRGEYMYHQLAWRNSWPDWQYLEDDALRENDAVVISLPFADTGNEHEQYTWLMEQCTRLGIPVLIDCAYYGISSDITYDFTWPCITDIAFSLSKYFPVAHARIGMRLTRVNDDDPLFVYQYRSYNNKYGARLGEYFMDLYTPDYLVETYRHKQIEFSRILGVRPSKTILFGIGDDRWSEYNRGCDTNRIGFHKHLPLSVGEFTTTIKEYYGDLLTQ